MKKLSAKLRSLEGKPYGYYKGLNSVYSFVDFELRFLHVQGDSYAPPSTLLASFPYENTGFPKEWITDSPNRVPLADLINRKLHERFSELVVGENGGRFYMSKPGQSILPRSSVAFTTDKLEIVFGFGLPADGRSILAKKAEERLIGILPDCLFSSCCAPNSESLAGFSKHILHYRRHLDLVSQLRAGICSLHSQWGQLAPGSRRLR